MPPQTRALSPSARAAEMLVYIRLGRSTPADVLVVSVNVRASGKRLRSTVAAAPFCAGCPAGYSGCDGVVTSGSQSGSRVVSGLPSRSASGIAVTGRHVTSVAIAPYHRLAVQILNAVSAIAILSTPKRRLASDIERCFAVQIWFAAWFQCTLA